MKFSSSHSVAAMLFATEPAGFAGASAQCAQDKTVVPHQGHGGKEPDAEGKRRNQAPAALARRRSDVLFPMLRDGTPYQDPEPPNLPSAG